MIGIMNYDLIDYTTDLIVRDSDVGSTFSGEAGSLSLNPLAQLAHKSFRSLSVKLIVTSGYNPFQGQTDRYGF